ncbi:MAG: hypothetical protein ACLFTB_03485 [Desulfovibrionales bacterium]
MYRTSSGVNCMERRIFELGLSVEAVSLYLLLDFLHQAGLPLTREPIEARWTGTPEKLDHSLQELELQNVIKGESDEYKVLPSEQWRAMGSA